MIFHIKTHRGTVRAFLINSIKIRFLMLNISPHGDAILKKLKIWLNACIILLLLLYLSGVIFSAKLKFKGKILA
jgi:hypothetical protein